MPKLSEGLYNFLNARRTPTNADLVARWSIEMECQINVAADNGEPVDGRRGTYTDGEFTWFNIRIPKNAAGDPEFKDYELRCPLDLHAEGIGMTGWKWTTRRSLWCAFDFDSITGHAKGIGISDVELERVKQAAMSLPYVEVRKSTGGAGIHLYIYFAEGVPTDNHTEHAALGRCALGMMSSETGFDFASQIDACGGNMWVWHRKMTPENEGLKIIKPAEKLILPSDLPSNWRDHIEVVTRRRSKVRVHAELKDEFLDPFEALTSARRIVPLDDAHKEMIEELSHSGYTTIWVSDHHLLQTHTKALELMVTEHKAKGILKTNSKGSDKGTPNCFMFPLDQGGWRVYRFSPGVGEAETWTQDKEGWTNCYFNCKPNLQTAARAMGAQEDPDHGGFIFETVAEAAKAAEVLGQHIDTPGSLQERQACLKVHRNGRIIISISKKRGEQDKTLHGWISKPDAWVKFLNIPADPNISKQVRKPRITIPRISCAELARGCYKTEYLIDQMLVAREPCILGGAKKCLKTTVLLDMMTSLATGEPFLRRFQVTRACRVGVISGESGVHVIQETLQRICRSMNISLEEIKTLTLSTFIPRLDDPDHLDALDRFIRDIGAEVIAIDPTYLAMCGSEAGNLMSQGERLARVNEVCQRNNAGLILAHHNTRTSERRSKHKPPELDSLAWAGYAEWARQWILLGRREDYMPGSGEHRLFLNSGGSAGHSSLWLLNANEGPSGEPRHWKVTLSTPSEACEKKEAKEAISRRERILEAASTFPHGDSMSRILAKANIKHDKKASDYFKTLVAEGALVECKVKKKGGTCVGFCLAQAS